MVPSWEGSTPRFLYLWMMALIVVHCHHLRRGFVTLLMWIACLTPVIFNIKICLAIWNTSVRQKKCLRGQIPFHSAVNVRKFTSPGLLNNFSICQRTCRAQVKTEGSQKTLKVSVYLNENPYLCRTWATPSTWISWNIEKGKTINVMSFIRY